MTKDNIYVLFKIFKFVQEPLRGGMMGSNFQVQFSIDKFLKEGGIVWKKYFVILLKEQEVTFI